MRVKDFVKMYRGMKCLGVEFMLVLPFLMKNITY